MTHYELTQLATRACEHGKGTVCMCSRKTPSPAVQTYLDKAKAKYPHSIMYNPEWTPENSRRDKYRWVEYPSHGLRFVGKVHELHKTHDAINHRMVDHNGWYVDSFQGELCYGEVYQLPARNGEVQYVPANCDPFGNDGAILDFHSITSDLADAINWADSMAKAYAEESRESEAKDRAEERIAEIGEEITSLYQGVKILAREIRANCDKLTGLGEVRQLIRAEVDRVREEIAELREEKSKLENNYWESVLNW